MTLQDAIQQRLPLAVAVMRDHERLAAEVYFTDDGVVFLDIGWNEPAASSFRAHHMAGTVSGGGPWTVGDWTIREVDPETDDDYVRELNRWQQVNGGASREQGAAFASQVLEMDVRV